MQTCDMQEEPSRITGFLSLLPTQTPPSTPTGLFQYNHLAAVGL